MVRRERGIVSETRKPATAPKTRLSGGRVYGTPTRLGSTTKESIRERNLEDWQRLQQIIDDSGLTINAFARHIGLSRGENLYQIKRGHNGISRDLALRIHTHFPQYGIGWLLTGIDDSPGVLYAPYSGWV